MSGSAPTPRIFGRPAEEMLQNSGSGESGGQPTQRQSRVFGQDAPDWWLQKPGRTTLATTTGQNLEGSTNAFD